MTLVFPWCWILPGAGSPALLAKTTHARSRRTFVALVLLKNSLTSIMKLSCDGLRLCWITIIQESANSASRAEACRDSSSTIARQGFFALYAGDPIETHEYRESVLCFRRRIAL